MAKFINIREVPPKIISGAKLKLTTDALQKSFEAGEERNAELTNSFFNQPYFKWEESLINEFSKVQPDIDFDYIKEEWINLALLLDNEWLKDFETCIKKIRNDNIKKALIQQIHDKILNKIWSEEPYKDFDTECNTSSFITETHNKAKTNNVTQYFENIKDYLNEKSTTNWKSASEILKDIIITNDELNQSLPTWEQISSWIPLKDSTVPNETRNDFDTLLSFEIGKEADRTIDIAKDIAKELKSLYTNSLPAINTIVWENDEFKFNENILWNEYKWELETIKNNKKLSENKRNKLINDLKRKHYLKYLKTKNKTIWDTLEELYNNNFDYSKINPKLLESYLDKVADIRLNMLSDKWITNLLKLDSWNIDEFSKFYKWLAKCSISEIPLDPSRWITLHVEKKIKKWENLWLKDIEEFWKNAKSSDTLPIIYNIKKKDIDNLHIDIEDRIKLLNFLSRFTTDGKNYIISGWDVWMLIYLFFVINSNPSIINLNLDKQKEIEKLFWQAKEHEKSSESKNEENKENREKENQKEKNFLSTEKFKEKIEKFWPWKFENWAEIWVPFANSELPWWWHQWMKIKISKIDMEKWTFTGKAFWWELKLSEKFEWISKEFKMDEKFFTNLNKLSKDSNKIWILPDPKNSDFNTFKDKLNNKLWKFPMDWVKRTGNKFTRKIIDEKWKEKETEIKYFWASSDNKSTYKIEYNPTKKVFNVSSSFNWEEKEKDWQTKKKRFSYKRDMDRNNFLIFFTQKWLVPQTKEESNNAIQRQNKDFKMVNGRNWKLNWFSFNNIKNVFKTIKWNISKKIDDYDKSQEEKLQDILIWDWWLYNGLAKVLGFMPSMKHGLWELQQEYYNERDNRTRKKIEYYLKIFQADPDFWTTFDQIPPHAKIQWWKSLQEIVLLRVKNAKDRMWEPWLHQAAALLLANFEKWWSPYRWLSEKENTWLRITALLWKAHYQQFMRDKADLIRARDAAEQKWSTWDKKWLNETLAACEMKYIINNIRWSYKWLIVWSYEERWIPWKDNTNYIDNPAKRLLSDQFASKLETAYNWRFNKWSVDEKYNKFKNNNSFDEIENEFGKAGSTRYQIWQAALRRMIDLATTDDLKKRMKTHFLTYLLSWALDVNCDPWLKKQIYGWAKLIMFVPWLLVKEAGVAENIAILLDDATWDFYKHVSKYFHRNKQLKWWVDFKWLQKELKARLTDERIAKLEKYFSKLPTKDLSKYTEPKLSIIKKYQNAMSDSNRDEADWKILENAKVVSNWLLSSVEVAQKRLNVKNWKFNGNDIDENNNMQEFRENVTKDIEWRDFKNPREVAFVLDKLFNRFELNNQQIYTWILTADYYNKHKWPFILPYNDKVSLDMWNIWDKEINSILRYAFKWNAWNARWLWCDKLPDSLINTLDAFNTFFSNAFKEGTLLNDYVVKHGFKPKPGTIPLCMGSRETYDQAFAWDWELQLMADSTEEDLSSWDSEKQKKARKQKKKTLLKSNDFINSDIANIEKKLKWNLGSTSTQFLPVTSSHSQSLRESLFKPKAA